MSALDIRGSGTSWAIMRGKAQIAGPYWGEHLAIAALRGVKRRLRSTTRACICCTAPFASTGKAHRMCAPCRKDA